MKKRLLSILLVLLMCMTMLPASVLATDTEPDTGNEIVTDAETGTDGDISADDEVIENDYILKVAGIDVTPENQDDIMGDGCVSFDPETCTLTLTDAGVSNDSGYGIYAENMDLIIHGIDTAAPGNNEISSKDIVEIMTEEETAIQPCAAIYSENGTVTITGVIGDVKAQNTGIYGSSGVNIKGTVGDIIIESRDPDFPTGTGIQTISGPIDITGTVGDILVPDGAIDASDGNITISGTVGNVTGCNAIRVSGGDLYITGTVAGIDRGPVTDMGGCAISAYAAPYYDEELGDFNGTYGGDVHISGKIGIINGCACGIWSDGDIIISKTDVKVIVHDETDSFAVVALGEILAREALITEPADYTIEYYDYGEGIEYKVISDKDGNFATTVNFSDGNDECDGTGPCPAAPYSDVDPAEWYHKAVDYVLENGLMNGVGGGLFDVSGTTNRAMIVTMLWRLEGGLDYGMDITKVFTDVPDNEWYTEAVTWAYVNGIVDGLGDGLYGPLAPVTREQLATILYRYAAYRTGDIGTEEIKPADPDANLVSFVDADSVSSWALDAMNWAVGEGIISGKGNNDLVPGGNASRVETAQMFMNFLS